MVPNWVILIEGGSETTLLEAACREMLVPAVLTAAGAAEPIERGLYQLQYGRCATPGTAG